jgi:hypothetical protein
LRRTARDAGPVGHDPGYGWGLINADELLSTTALKGPGSRHAAAM